MSERIGVKLKMSTDGELLCKIMQLLSRKEAWIELMWIQSVYNVVDILYVNHTINGSEELGEVHVISTNLKSGSVCQLS